MMHLLTTISNSSTTVAQSNDKYLQQRYALQGINSSNYLYSKHEPESPLIKSIITATMTWFFELSCGHYLEFLKISKQTKEGSYFKLTKEIVSQKGIIGIWDGFFPWGTFQAVAKGAVFGFGHAMSLTLLQPLVHNETLSSGTVEILAGGCGGGFQGLVLSPALLLKTRVMTDPKFRQNATLVETTKKSFTIGLEVFKKEKLFGLMKGSAVFSLKRVADWTTRFFFSVQVEELFFKRNDKHRKLTSTEQMTASLIGGVLSSLSTIPIDVLVAQIQQASKAGQHVSIFRTFKDQFQKGGFNQVVAFSTKGFVARTIHVALTTVLMKTMTSMVYKEYENFSK